MHIVFQWAISHWQRFTKFNEFSSATQPFSAKDEYRKYKKLKRNHFENYAGTEEEQQYPVILSVFYTFFVDCDKNASHILEIVMFP